MAAAKASFSTVTAYRIGSDPRPPSQKQMPRTRRRSDPLADIFDKEVVPLLVESPSRRAVTIFDELCRRHPKLPVGVRRTIERRVRQWRALHGPAQEVIFAQRNPPGRLGLSDFSATGQGRHNARHRARIDAERAVLGPLPARRTQDFELERVQITSHSGFTLRKVFYALPSRLIGHTLRVHLYDDRLELLLGSSPLLTLPRGRAHSDGRRGHVVNYHHSSMLCAASRWPCSTSSTAINCSLATPTAAPSMRCSMPSMSAPPAGAWSSCWLWPTIAAARQRWPHSLPTCSRLERCLNWNLCRRASAPIRNRYRNSMCAWGRQPTTTICSTTRPARHSTGPHRPHPLRNGAQ